MSDSDRGIPKETSNKRDLSSDILYGQKYWNLLQAGG
jgi:hypothetical protein